MKKILLISYFYPPAGGPRAIRWYKLVKYLLKDEDIQICIITAKISKKSPHYDGSFPLIENTRLKVHYCYPGPLHKRVYGDGDNGDSKAPEGYAYHKKESHGKFQKMLKNLMIPEKEIEWIPFAIREAKRIMAETTIDYVISSGAPFSDHLIARYIINKTSARLILDYGDPWSFRFGLENVIRKKIEQKLEKYVLSAKPQIIVTTEETKKLFMKEFSLKGNEIFVLPNAYDPEDFSKVFNHTRISNHGIINLVSIGAQYGMKCDFNPFFEALQKIMDINKKINYKQIGFFEKPPLVKNFKDRIKFLGQLTYESTLEYFNEASILILFGWKNGHQIPSRIFNYIGANKTILTILGDEGDPLQNVHLLKQSGLVTSNNTAKIFDALQKLLETNVSSPNYNKIDLYQMSWKQRMIDFKKVLSL